MAVDNALHAGSAQSGQQQLRYERDRMRLLLEVNSGRVSSGPRRTLHSRQRLLEKGDSTRRLQPLALRRGEWRIRVLDFSTNESFIEQGHVGSVTWSPSCVAIETGKQAIFREKDLQEMSAISEIARRLLANGLKSFCSVPLMSHNRTMGALNIGRRGGDGFTTEDIELLSQVAQQIALAVENAVAYASRDGPSAALLEPQ